MVNKFFPLGAPCRGRGRPKADASALSREDILRLAFVAFARDGYDGLSMRALAGECGISNSMLHHHFSTKRDLWFEVADSVFAPLFARQTAVVDALQGQGDEVEVLRAAMRSAFTLAGEATEVLNFMFRAAEVDDERGAYIRDNYLAPYMARIDALIAAGKAAGSIAEVPGAGMHTVVLGVMRFLLQPGMLQQKLTPHLADPASRASFVESLVETVTGGFLKR